MRRIVLYTDELTEAPCSECMEYYPLDQFAGNQPYTDEPPYTCRGCAAESEKS